MFGCCGYCLLGLCWYCFVGWACFDLLCALLDYLVLVLCCLYLDLWFSGLNSVAACDSFGSLCLCAWLTCYDCCLLPCWSVLLVLFSGWLFATFELSLLVFADCGFVDL